MLFNPSCRQWVNTLGYDCTNYFPSRGMPMGVRRAILANLFLVHLIIIVTSYQWLHAGDP